LVVHRILKSRQRVYPVIEFPLLLMFPAAMAFAGAMDLFTMTIPNRVSLALIAAFAVVVAMTGAPLTVVINHIGAGIVFLGVGIFMFSMRWLGGGDAKLLAAAALWLGFDSVFPYLVLVTVLGGLLAVGLLSFRSIAPPVWMMRQEWALRLHDRQGGIPYGIALAGAALWVYPTTPWFLAFA
jgi:prepilin peptidase CpaA